MTSPTTMWAQQLTAPRHFTEVEAPRPEATELGPDEVLVRVLAGAICGSDLPVFNGLRTLKQRDDPTADNTPGSPMHELVGEVVGHNMSTLDHAMEAAAPGGRIFYFGIPDDAIYPVNMQRLLRKNLTLSSGITRQRRRMLVAAGDHLARYPGLVHALVTDVFDAAHAQTAYELATGPRPETGKITLRMG